MKIKSILMWVYIISVTAALILMIVLYIQKSVGVDICNCQVCQPNIEVIKKPVAPAEQSS